MLTSVIQSPNPHAHTIPEQKKEALGSLRSVGFAGAYVRRADSIDERAEADISHSTDDKQH